MKYVGNSRSPVKTFRFEAPEAVAKMNIVNCHTAEVTIIKAVNIESETKVLV